MANTNPDVQPYAPDPNALPGKPPIAGVQTGERGTSAFPGNAAYDANGQYIEGGGAPGPDLGLNYYQNEAPEALTSGAGSTATRSTAGSHVPDADFTNVVTASTLTPAANASVDLTCTLTASSGEEYPITGTVTFKDGATTLHTATITDTSSPSVTTWTNASGFAAGSHTITAVYSGDGNWATSTSAPITVTAS